MHSQLNLNCAYSLLSSPFSRIFSAAKRRLLSQRDMMIAVVALILGILLGGFVLIPRRLKSAQRDTIRSNVSVKKVSQVYSKAEVSSHNTRTDCWVIIKGKVYDVTSYVEEHPGGDAILNHAGDDSTEGFYGPQHATRVFDMIDDFYIGELEK